MSKTGKVATYGGLNIPPVTIYMDGFWEGVQYYNKQNNKNVQVLGWDEKNQKGGTFANSFTDANKGKQITQQFQQQGADIVFPVAGGTGLGSAAAAAASGGQLSVIWVDTDGCVSVPQYCKYFLTSGDQEPHRLGPRVRHAGRHGHLPDRQLHRHAGERRHRPRAVPRLRQQGPVGPEDASSTRSRQDIISGKINITSPSQPQ